MLRRTPNIIECSSVLVASTTSVQSRFPPFLTALAAHVAGLAAALALAAGVMFVAGRPLLLFLNAVFEGGVAAYLSFRWGMRPWWIPIQFLFFPLLLVLLSLQIAPSFFLGLFLLMVSVYWSVFRSQVPLYLSSNQAWQAVAGILPKHAGVRMIDLGSGIGGMLKFLSGACENVELVGIEAAPLPFFLGWLRTTGNRCRMRFGSLWDVDLAGFDVAYAYLSPVPMSRLWEKVKEEMHPGSLFISNTFAVPDVMPAATVQLDDFHKSTLYIYRI